MESLRLPPHNNLTFVAISMYLVSSITCCSTKKGRESGTISWSWSFYRMSGCLKSHTTPSINLIIWKLAEICRFLRFDEYSKFLFVGSNRSKCLILCFSRTIVLIYIRRFGVKSMDLCPRSCTMYESNVEGLWLWQGHPHSIVYGLEFSFVSE